VAERLTTEQAAARAAEFLGGFRALVLATTGNDGTPDASYAPFVRGNDNVFYIYVSRLARHTSNLDATGQASVLLIENEADAEEIFARKRLTLRCAVWPIDRHDARWAAVMDRFAVQFGSVIELIRPLEDFVLFALEPTVATYVEGFAQAYRLENAELDCFFAVNDR